METQTVTIALTRGENKSISGEVVGPFIIHRPAGFSWCAAKGWHITHIKSGLRFPWSFSLKEKARLFARRARKMTDWDRVGARMADDPNDARGVWTTELPTPEDADLPDLFRGLQHLQPRAAQEIAGRSMHVRFVSSSINRD